MSSVMEEKYMLTKWLNNELTKEELKDFKQNPDYSLYKSIKEHSSTLKTKDFDEDVLLQSIISKNSKTQKVIALSQKWFFRIAAILLISLSVIVFYQQSDKAIEFAEKGAKTTFNLPDNSIVTLNSDSKIEFSEKNWDDNRALKLEGEAYFKVAKGKKFEVSTNLGKITVLGTQFDVKERKNRLEVVCYEGKVQVAFNEELILLTQGERVVFENNRLFIQNKTVALSPSWLESEITFEQEHLKNIIDEIERQYNLKIKSKFGSLQSEEELFTAKIPTNNLQIALKILSTTYHLETKKVSDFQYELKRDE